MIFRNQTSLRIKLTTNVDITGSTVRQIKYRKPSGQTGNWTALSEDDALGIIYYDVQTGDINESGNWVIWAYVTFSDSRSAPGEIIKVKVYEEGEDS
jgi:hypothetical protein